MTKARDEWEDEQDRQQAEELCGSYKSIRDKLIDLQTAAVLMLGKDEARDIVKGLCDAKSDVQAKIEDLEQKIAEPL